MDTLKKYQQIIKETLVEYDRISAQVSDPDIDELLMFDDERGQYLWLNVGWKKSRRISTISVYVRLKNNKVYIEEDWTEEGIATDLLKKGIPAEDIVLAFQSPDARQFTEFAVA